MESNPPTQIDILLAMGAEKNGYVIQRAQNAPLRETLKNMGVELDDEDVQNLENFFAALDSYGSKEIPFTVDDSGPGIRIVETNNRAMLEKLEELKIGIFGLCLALGEIDAKKLLDAADETQRKTYEMGMARAVTGYCAGLYEALNLYYKHLWHFHPGEEAAADFEGRDAEQGHYPDVFHPGMFNLCVAIDRLLLSKAKRYMRKKERSDKKKRSSKKKRK